MAEWVKSCIKEIVESVTSDTDSNRYFAYLTRWTQPEELYHRALYVLFIADKAAIPHIVSGEPPNSLSQMWKEVDRVVYDGRSMKQMGLNGEEFTAMDTLNNAAHASFATIVTCIDVTKNRDKWKHIIDKHIAYWKLLCANLDRIEKGSKRERVGQTF